MKNLVDYINEGWQKHIDVKDIDMEAFKKMTEKIGNDKDSLGAGVAMLKFEMVNFIVEKIAGERNIDVHGATYKKDVPIYSDEIEKILADNFNFFKSKEGNIYLAPKKTSKASVKRWLGDDFYGTVDNPMYD